MKFNFPHMLTNSEKNILEPVSLKVTYFLKKCNTSLFEVLLTFNRLLPIFLSSHQKLNMTIRTN